MPPNFLVIAFYSAQNTDSRTVPTVHPCGKEGPTKTVAMKTHRGLLSARIRSVYMNHRLEEPQDKYRKITHTPTILFSVRSILPAN
jgi:hypothetical protein